MVAPLLVLLWGTVILCVLLGFARPAFAEVGDISIGGVWVCRLTKGAAGLTLDQRMMQIERRIFSAINNPKYRDQRQMPVVVRPMGQNAAVTVDDVVIFVVTPEDVEGTGAKPMEAAVLWGQRLARGLNLAIPDGKFQVF
jgi:hypothetical protein